MIMTYSNIHVACMFRADSTSTMYLLHGNKMPDEPIVELKRQFPDENYIRGFLLDDDRYQEVVLQLIDDWKKYDQSLNGLWHHPHFPKVFEERRAQSIYTFHDIDWVIAGIKGDTTSLLRNESIDRQQNV